MVREIRFYGSRAALSLQVERSGIRLESISIPEIGEEFVQEATRERWIYMIQEAPVKTAALRQSIQYRTSGLEGEVTIGVPYVIFVLSGTRPHVIRPVRASVLRFEVEGCVVFAMRVSHPGTRPNPFIRRADERLAHRIAEIFQRVWERRVRE